MADGTFDDEIAVEEMASISLGDVLSEMVTLTREGYHEMGTFGTLRYKDFECKTVERPWANNKPFISCIPPGIYPIKLGRFNRGNYPCWEVCRVPNRTYIKIHRGNTARDVQGCIAVGSEFGIVDRMWAVTNSSRTHDAFMAAMRDNDAHKSNHMYLNIKNLDIGTWSAPAYAMVG
jgi:hypothetical protein